MRFYWIQDRVKQKQFEVRWRPGKLNLADYPTKHHTGKHHQQVRPIYLYDPHNSPKTVQGCIKILAGEQKPIHKAMHAHDKKQVTWDSYMPKYRGQKNRQIQSTKIIHSPSSAIHKISKYMKKLPKMLFSLY